MKLRLAFIALFALVIAACGDSDSDSADDEGSSATTTVEVEVELEDAAVEIVGFAFAPAELTVPAGTTVVFTNQDETLHTVTPVEGPTAFGGGVDGVGSSVEVTFEEAGRFEYICTIHPGMAGAIVVE